MQQEANVTSALHLESAASPDLGSAPMQFVAGGGQRYDFRYLQADYALTHDPAGTPGVCAPPPAPPKKRLAQPQTCP